jgi:hypothetical protein
MLTALDIPDEALDDGERNVIAGIREYGWFRHSIFGDEDGPGFSYTTGFWVTAAFPEIIVFSLKSDIIHDILWDVFRNVKAGRPPAMGVATSDIFVNLPAMLLPVSKRFYADYLGWDRWFHAGDEFPCLQLVWPDREGVFPWQHGFDETFRDDQPDLTDNGWTAALAN